MMASYYEAKARALVADWAPLSDEQVETVCRLLDEQSTSENSEGVALRSVA